MPPVLSDSCSQRLLCYPAESDDACTCRSQHCIEPCIHPVQSEGHVAGSDQGRAIQGHDPTTSMWTRYSDDQPACAPTSRTPFVSYHCFSCITTTNTTLQATTQNSKQKQYHTYYPRLQCLTFLNQPLQILHPPCSFKLPVALTTPISYPLYLPFPNILV